MRLLEPVLDDALYARAPFFNFLLEHRKHLLVVVLKDERWNLYRHAVGLFASVPPVKGSFRSCDCLVVGP